MYDSITSHLIRLARRSWIVIVVVLLLGGLLGGLVAQRRTSWTARATIQVADVSTAAGLLGISTIDTKTSLRPIVIRSVEDFEATESNTTITATPDEAASVIVAVATGPNVESVETSLDQFEAIVETRATDPRVAEADAALASNDATLELFASDLEMLDEQLATLDQDDPARLSIVDSRTSIQSDIRELESSSEGLRQYRSLLENSLVATIGTTVEGPSSATMSVIVGIIAMAILLAIFGTALVITDQKIRRRLQVERILPGTPILGVLPSGTDQGDEFREAARSIDRFVERAGAKTAVVVELGRATAIAALQPCSTSTLVELDGDVSLANTPVIVIAEWGRSTENEVAARVASLETSGNGSVGLIIANVPPRDIDWAGATGRGVSSSGSSLQ